MRGKEGVGMTDPAKIDESYRGCRAASIVSVEIEGETVIYHDFARTIHVLNRSATEVWNSLDGVTEVRDVAVRLAKFYEVDETLMMRQVVDIVLEFGRQGLLDGVAPDPDTVQEIRLDLLRSSELRHG
jgi:plasmid maintenance system antidote protein VapI